MAYREVPERAGKMLTEKMGIRVGAGWEMGGQGSSLPKQSSQCLWVANSGHEHQFQILNIDHVKTLENCDRKIWSQVDFFLV